jgi:hypothetical protein
MRSEAKTIIEAREESAARFLTRSIKSNQYGVFRRWYENDESLRSKFRTVESVIFSDGEGLAEYQTRRDIEAVNTTLSPSAFERYEAKTTQISAMCRKYGLPSDLKPILKDEHVLYKEGQKSAARTVKTLPTH